MWLSKKPNSAISRQVFKFHFLPSPSFLYTLMADPALSSSPFLILANKQDETMAKGASVVKTLLEKEM